jgi:hypothetical protein
MQDLFHAFYINQKIRVYIQNKTRPAAFGALAIGNRIWYITCYLHITIGQVFT